MNGPLRLPKDDLDASGMVSILEHDCMADYLAMRYAFPTLAQYIKARVSGDLPSASSNHNILTDAFMTIAMTSAFYAITHQALGTNSTATTALDSRCTKEFYRKVINADGRAQTTSQLVFATFFGSAEATSARGTVIASPAPTTTTVNLDSLVTNGVPGFRIGDTIRVANSTPGGYEYPQITGITGNQLQFAALSGGAPAAASLVDQCLMEACLHLGGTYASGAWSATNAAGTLDQSSVDTINSARSGTSGNVTIVNGTGFANGDFVRVRMADVGSQVTYETGVLSAKTLVAGVRYSFTVTFSYTGTNNFYTVGASSTMDRGAAANHALLTLPYVKPTGRSVVVESVITLTQVP